MSIELYSTLTAYGDQILLSPNLHDTEGFVEWTEENFEYVRYNPRKKKTHSSCYTYRWHW